MKDLLERLKTGVVEVGIGRGFLVASKTRALIITAAHCLPRLPEAYSASATSETTFAGLVKPIGEKEALTAQCIFADPIADIAILSSPDDSNTESKFNAIFAKAEKFKIEHSLAEASEFESMMAGRMLSLDGSWMTCTIRCINNGPLWIEDAKEGIMAGMSGSPVVSPNGSAIGVICTASTSSSDGIMTQGGPNPHLMVDLPARILRDLRKTKLRLQT